MRINRINLIAEMARQEISVAELAEKAGVSRATITALRGGKSCSSSTACHVCRALGVSIDYLRKEEASHGTTAVMDKDREYLGDRPAV